MSTTVMSDAMVMPAMESPPLATKLIDQTADVEFVKCDCCGLTEECTPGYIERIRERYKGKWICGLCGEAVKDEIVRNERLISTEEAMARHINFCRTPISSGPPPDPAVHLIAAMRQILRRSLDSPTSVRSMPCSPTTKNTDAAGLTRSESCISSLALTSGSSSYHESGDDSDRKNQTP
ncbi:uncharacterized protein LOC112516990 [Cynara cardunculus var. scolymus]|uniref:DUF1677 domain-containing protein n=1 Tax=Cynara cardunculus var. scolymus TaxID=59895 RepID=A0A103XLD3_CYNCS|nr:uncharacterized protein LOC112516990 [Cynara cardunculus var. scolymus]KVH92897.1 Protein of unknown function DUF1677, plant [Cynara cardunculus var. scolymus]